MSEEENQILPGQRNIFEVIDDFEKVPKVAQKKKTKNGANEVPIPITVEEFLKKKMEKNSNDFKRE